MFIELVTIQHTSCDKGMQGKLTVFTCTGTPIINAALFIYILYF